MILKSNSVKWLELSNKWFNAVSNNVDALYTALEEANKAIKKVSGQGDIGSLGISITEAGLEEHNEKRRRIVSFCNSIHYEMSELVDNPFSNKIGDTNQKLYVLNPSDIKVSTGRVLFWDTEMPLTKLIAATFLDDKLKGDFEEKYKKLDEDEPSKLLKEAFIEAKFWKSEFEKSNEIKVIAGNVFTDKVRKQWPSMTIDERKKVINDYVDQIGQVFYGEPNWWQKLFGMSPSIMDVVKYDASGNGVSRGSGEIAVNIQFITSPKGNYSVDKLIDTLTHETRHEYQYIVRSDPNKYGAPQGLANDWNSAYVQYDPQKHNFMDYYKQPLEEDSKAFAALSRPD